MKAFSNELCKRLGLVILRNMVRPNDELRRVNYS